MKEQTATTEKQITPHHIMQVGMGFWASKTLLTAVNLELFTHLDLGPLSAREIQQKTGLHDRSLYDFLDSLVALGFLKREGLKEKALYSNTEETEMFLDKRKPSYIGGLLEMANHRLYPFWGNLEEGLKTGKPQNEIKHKGENIFDALYEDPERLREFMMAMQGAQMGSFIALAKKFDFTPYNTLCDIGGASGALSIQVALNNDHMNCISADLAPVLHIARENIDDFKLQERIQTRVFDFFENEFPKADVITMGNILHDWGLETKKMLIKKAYEALPKGGAMIIIENIIDSGRKENAFGLLMSLNMLIETEEGFDYTFSDFDKWARNAGFSKTELLTLAGPTSAAIAYK